MKQRRDSESTAEAAPAAPNDKSTVADGGPANPSKESVTSVNDRSMMVDGIDSPNAASMLADGFKPRTNCGIWLQKSQKGIWANLPVATIWSAARLGDFEIQDWTTEEDVFTFRSNGPIGPKVSNQFHTFPTDSMDCFAGQNNVFP